MTPPLPREAAVCDGPPLPRDATVGDGDPLAPLIEGIPPLELDPLRTEGGLAIAWKPPLPVTFTPGPIASIMPELIDGETLPV